MQLKYLIAAAAANEVGLSRERIYAWIREGRLKPAAITAGEPNVILYDPEDVHRLARECAQRGPGRYPKRKESNDS